MPAHECWCDKPATHQCAGCRKEWYCSKECQRDAWTLHIFNCNPKKPIKTFHYLARAVFDDLLPEHPQTCEDYGFYRTERPEMLLGVYVYLIKYKQVKAQTLHEWRLQGTLVENIMKQYDEIPESHRGTYYTWFVQNQHVVSGEGEAKSRMKQAAEMDRRGWCFIGRSPTASDDEIWQYTQSLPEGEKNCFYLYTFLVSGGYPRPGVPLWIPFGFCACSHQVDEMGLAQTYRTLIHRCTFAEFHNAYTSSLLPSLFESKGLKLENPCVIDVLTMGPSWNKSVWDLKEYIELKNIHGPTDTTINHTRSVGVDYGFYNCRSPEEHKLLLNIYKEFFSHYSSNPLELHQACIQGRLFSYFAEDLKFKVKPQKTYKRLFKNPYPLPVL